jgi:hypothetical protein
VSFLNHMIIRTWITEKEVEAALNEVPPDPPSYARFLEKLLEGNGPPDKPSDWAFLRTWVEDTSRIVRSPQAGFVLNYLVYAPFIQPVSSAQAHQGWQLPDAISLQESMPTRDALTSAHLRVYVDAWLDTSSFVVHAKATVHVPPLPDRLTAQIFSVGVGGPVCRFRPRFFALRELFPKAARRPSNQRKSANRHLHLALSQPGNSAMTRARAYVEYVE